MIRQRRQQIQRQRISPKLKMTLLSSGFFALAAFALVIYSSTGLQLNAVAGQGMMGEKSMPIGQTVINEFTSLTEDVKAGSTQLNVADNILNTNGRFAGNLQPGELVMIIQMQNGPKQYIDLNEDKGIIDEAGKYEFAEVAGVEEGPKINLTASLKNSYSISGRTQIVRVPRLQSLTVPKGATITTDSWDGSTGGILALEVKGNATINGTIDVTGKGFNSKAFQKLLKTASEARKQIITSDSTGSRIYLGAAAINKTMKTQSSGGGIVFMIVSGTIDGIGTIKADGNSVLMPNGELQANGGQGGSAYISSGHTAGNLTITATGGNALQYFDSIQPALQTDRLPPSALAVAQGSAGVATTRGMGGEGGIIRIADIHTFKCMADGGLNASVITNIDGVESRDSSKAASGLVTVSNLTPYSKDPASSTKLEYFAATSMNKSVKVSWVTVSEINVDFFTVERSIDGSDFIPVFKTDGKGNAFGKSSYQFDDAAQSANDCQYRLTQTSNDNHTEIYPAVRLKQSGKSSDTKLISVQPNPIGDHFTIQCMISEPGIIDITLTDISGNVVRKETAVAGEGMNTISVNNLSEIPKGTYFLSLVSGTQKMQTVKILK